MKLCIPVCHPNGLESVIEPHLPDAEHILLFDMDTRKYEQVSLRNQEEGASRSIQMDAVLCGSINRPTLRRLFEQGVKVYGIQTQTVAQAIAQFESGELEAVAEHAGGCGGQDGAHGHEGGGCCSGQGKTDRGCSSHGQSSGAGQSCQGAGGGCHAHTGEAKKCCGDHEQSHSQAAEKPRGDVLTIAVCSQNRKTVTEHAGKCRKFWIYKIEHGQVIGRSLLELPIEQSFHETIPSMEHPLDIVDILIAASMGDGLKKKLLQRGIQGVVTTDTDPEQAVSSFLAEY